MSAGATSVSYDASDSAAYELFVGRWTRLLAEPMIDFASFPGEGDLIDVGCGTGSLAFAMAERWKGRRILGIDVAAPYIEFALLRAAGGNPHFELGDACRLPYPDGRFAGAGAQLVLNFVGDAGSALAEMRRITRRNGVVAACVWDFRGGLVNQRLFWDTAAVIDPAAGAARDRLFSSALALPDGLSELFRAAGLGGIARQSLTIRMDYADFADYWRPLFGAQGPVGRYAAGLAPALATRIEAAVRAAYLAGAPDGPRSMTATAWAVRGIVS